jgi:hemoglobin
VADLVQSVQVDARIRDSYDGTDFVRLAAKLEEQFCEVAGGPCKYSGKDMKTIHEDLKVNRAQFNALVENLQGAMAKNDVPSRTQNRLLARLAPMHREVVTR